MNEFDMIVAIVFITMASVVLMVRYKYLGDQRQAGGAPGQIEDQTALESEVRQLRERVKVLERIAVEKEDSLTQQIEQLRDR